MRARPHYALRTFSDTPHWLTKWMWGRGVQDRQADSVGEVWHSWLHTCSSHHWGENWLDTSVGNGSGLWWKVCEKDPVASKGAMPQMFWRGLHLPTCHYNRGSTELTTGHKFAICFFFFFFNFVLLCIHCYPLTLRIPNPTNQTKVLKHTSELSWMNCFLN